MYNSVEQSLPSFVKNPGCEETTNPKIEIRISKQIRRTKIRNCTSHQLGEYWVWEPVLSILSFGFRICFEFRYSDFEFNA